MKKIALSLLVGVLSLSSLQAKDIDGYDIYKKNCTMCHIEMISKAETLKRFKTLKAPPMVEVSHQLKDQIIIKQDDEDIHRFTVVSFIKEYLKKPSIDYSMCNPGAIDHFGIMPSQAHLNDAERQAVAEWIYDRYEDVETDFKGDMH